MAHLKPAHFHPRSFEKMRVNYATSMFSKDVLHALRCRNKRLFQGTIKYIETVRKFRNFFVTTIMTEENSEDVEKKAFALAATLERWEVESYSAPSDANSRVMPLYNELLKDAASAVNTIVEIAKTLVRDIPGSHIRFSWICQDALENVFCQQRASCGGSNNPTSQQWNWNRGTLNLRQHRYRSDEYNQSWLETYKPYIRKKKKCAFLPFLGCLLIKNSIVHALKSDLSQVQRAFPLQSNMFKAIGRLLTENALLGKIGSDMQRLIDPTTKKFLQSFFQRVGQYITELVPTSLSRIRELVALPLPEIHFLATLLCNSAIRFMPPTANIQPSPVISSYMDPIAEEVFYHHCGAIMSRLQNQFEQVFFFFFLSIIAEL